MPKQLPRLDHCLNCGAAVASNYCSECGQEAEDRTTGLKPLFSDLMAEMASFDSKLVRTVGPLLFQPGFLTNAYNEGKRVRYLSPLKMYLVASVVFFLILAYKLPAGENAIVNTGGSTTHSQNHQTKPGAMTSKTGGDTIRTGPAALKLDPGSIPENEEDFERWLNDKANSGKQSKFERFIVRQSLRVKKDPKSFGSRMLENVPKMMFVLLPLFALILKVIYIRSRRLYVEHLIFALHSHAFVFIVLGLADLVPYWQPTLIAFILAAIYLYAAMLRVYRQSVLKTALKFGILSFVYLLVLSFSLLGVLFVTFATI
jgi:hypothetical protein